VPPLGTLPAAYVAERVASWSVGAIGGPARAKAALEDGASLVLAAPDAAFARQVGDALAAAGMDVATTADVVGVELAGCAKNVAALAAAVAGPSASGAAAGKVFAEVDAYARRAGSRPETFAGLAGTGDLVATVLDAGDRRAGELLARGEIAPGEAVDCVPLLAARVREAGVDAPVLRGLAGMIEGRVEPARWTASLTAPKKRAKAGAVRAA
jgi:glycerol-3-phosphate dehydrogenase (NAD(P)+)